MIFHFIGKRSFHEDGQVYRRANRLCHQAARAGVVREVVVHYNTEKITVRLKLNRAFRYILGVCANEYVHKTLLIQ